MTANLCDIKKKSDNNFQIYEKPIGIRILRAQSITSDLRPGGTLSLFYLDPMSTTDVDIKNPDSKQ